MREHAELEQIASTLVGRDDKIESLIPLQTLWAGYGHICRLEVVRRDVEVDRKLQKLSLILKHVTPPPTKRKTSAVDEGHLRKVVSYQVEQYFYKHLAPRLPDTIAVAKCLGTIAPDEKRGTVSLLMSDLRTTFPVPGEQRAELNEKQVTAAIKWLAGFHAFWWKEAVFTEVKSIAHVKPPLECFAERASTVLDSPGVWSNGGYTYLATRRKEYADLESDDTSEWCAALCDPFAESKLSLAETVAAALATSSQLEPFQTLIHGDVKSENLFTTEHGTAVAFFDFQYVGRGLGVSDLAKLFTCSVPLSVLLDEENNDIPIKLSMQIGEEKLLRLYLRTVQRDAGKQYEWNAFIRHWEVALVDWLRFQASWGFWGNTEWLEARVRCILEDRAFLEWLRNTIE